MDTTELAVTVTPRGDIWEVSAGTVVHQFTQREQAIAVARELCMASAPAWLSIFDSYGLLVSQRHFVPNLALPWRRGRPATSCEYSLTGRISRDVFSS